MEPVEISYVEVMGVRFYFGPIKMDAHRDGENIVFDVTQDFRIERISPCPD